MDHQSPSYDAQPFSQSNRTPTVQNNQHVQSEAPHSDLPITDSPASTRTRFSRCPPGHICPHQNCSFPHRNNPGRLTRHWRTAHPTTIMPEAIVDQPFYDRRNSRIRQQQCPHPDCSFQHRRSMNILNAHLESAHSGQSLPQQHHLPHNMVPCHRCNLVIDHRATVRHARTCTRTPSGQRPPPAEHREPAHLPSPGSLTGKMMMTEMDPLIGYYLRESKHNPSYQRTKPSRPT